MDLSNLIYIDLLELYMLDLEQENKLLNIQLTAMDILKNQPRDLYTPPINQPYPWYPPYKVTCQNAVNS
jgi:hypothetical protein